MVIFWSGLYAMGLLGFPQYSIGSSISTCATKGLGLTGLIKKLQNGRAGTDSPCTKNFSGLDSDARKPKLKISITTIGVDSIPFILLPRGHHNTTSQFEISLYLNSNTSTRYQHEDEKFRAVLPSPWFEFFGHESRESSRGSPIWRITRRRTVFRRLSAHFYVCANFKCPIDPRPSK